MARALRPCSSCHRSIPVDASSCPFCDARQGPELVPPVGGPKGAAPPSRAAPLPAQPEAEPPPSTPSPPSNARHALVAAVVVVVLGGLAIGAWAIWGHHGTGRRAAGSTTTTTSPRARVHPLQLTPGWQFDPRDSFVSSVTTDGPRVYVSTSPTTTEQTTITALDARSGKQLWHTVLPKVSQAKPAAAHGVVAVFGAGDSELQSSLLVFDGATGKPRWQHKDVGYQSGAPLIAGSAIVLEGVNGDLRVGGMTGLDVLTGSPRWTLPDSGFARRLYSNAVSDGTRLYVPDTEGNAAAIDGTTGRSLWSKPVLGQSLALTAGGDLLLVEDDTSQPPPLSSNRPSARNWQAIDPTTGQVRWTRSLVYAVTDGDNGAVALAGRLILSARGIRAYRATTGVATWSVVGSGQSPTAPVTVADGHLLTVATSSSAGSQLRELDPVSGEVVRDTALGSTVVDQLVVADHLLVVESDQGLRTFRF